MLITNLVVERLRAGSHSYVFVQTGKDTLNVFLFFITSGVFSATAFSGGVPIALWGIAFYYIITFSWTILFFRAGRKIFTPNEKLDYFQNHLRYFCLAGDESCYLLCR